MQKKVLKMKYKLVLVVGIHLTASVSMELRVKLQKIITELDFIVILP